MSFEFEKVKGILDSNMRLPPDGEPCRVAINETKMAKYNSTGNSEPRFSGYKYDDSLIVRCNLKRLLSKGKGKILEEYRYLFAQQPLLKAEIQVTTNHDVLEILRKIEKLLHSQLKIYYSILTEPAIPSSSSLLKPPTGPTIPLFEEYRPKNSSRPSPFTEGGRRKIRKRTKKARKYRRRTSRS